MAVFTYIPTILAVAKFLKRFFNDHSATLKKYMGDALFALVNLLVDLCIIVASIIEGGHDADSQWKDFAEVNSFTSAQINEISAAITKFWTTIGVTP